MPYPSHSASAVCLAALLSWVPAGAVPAQESVTQMRRNMVAEVEAMVRDTAGYTGIKALQPPVVRALERVPRHEFVPVNLQSYAYLNQPLPIGHEQTISQPYIVALMTDLAELDPDSVVLEVGTGSGYQAAILGEVAARVYSIEIIEALGRRAERTLRRLGYDNVSVRIGDGYRGWPEQAPFDAIIVTAAPEDVPQPLLEQLKADGRLVLPVGPAGRVQSLQVLTRDARGRVQTRDILPVGFVPLIRER